MRSADCVFKYLDASLSHITESELDNLPGGEGITCTIRDHNNDIYGAWVYVSPILGEIDAEEFPNVLALVDLARQLGCNWICLDQDGPLLDDLPTFETDFCAADNCAEYPHTGEEFCPAHAKGETE